MDIPNTAAPAGVPPVSGGAPSKKPLIIAVSVLVLVLLGLAAWFFMRPAPTPSVFPLVENGARVWYALDGKELSSAVMPEEYRTVPTDLLAEGEFGAVYAENGDVVTLSSEGLVTFSGEGTRNVLISRGGLDYGSSAVAKDASAAALFNPATDAFDVFLLDRTVPNVLTYAGSVKSTGAIFGVGFPDADRLIVRTSETEFALYRIHESGVADEGAVYMKGTKTSLLETPVAHAWSYGSAPTSVGASVASGARCTGAQVATLGTASGSGTMPSIQTTIWSYMPTPANLPANYNNGTYCIQAFVTVTTVDDGGGDGGGNNGGGGKGGGEGVFLSPPRAHAQSQTWSVAYTAHSGTGTSASGNYYALTYATAPTASLTPSPSTINSGSSAALTWSSTNATSCTGTGFSTGSATAGTISVSPTATTTYSVSCTGSLGSASQSATVNVALRPNLTAGAVTPTSGSTGQAVNFSSTVTNSGVATAGASNMSFLIRAQGASTLTVGTAAIGSLAAGASAVGSYSHVFQGGGTYEVRACADYHPYQAGGGSVVTESNESDNCGAWANVSIASAPEVPVDAEITVTPNPATEGENVTITWSSTGANYCTGVGFSTGNATSGTVQGEIASTTEFGVSCYGSLFGADSGVYPEYSEWWTGDVGRGVAVVQNIQNGGYLPASYFDCSQHVGTEHWNRYVRSNNRVGDAGQDLITITCYPVTNPTGIISKPYERVYYPGGGCPGGCWEDRSYARSGDEVAVPPVDDGWDYDSVTVTVEETQCTNGEDDDGDTFFDEDDPGCEGDDDNDESDDPGITCNLTSNPSPLVGGASATFTWESENATVCTGTGFNTSNATDGTSASVTVTPGGTYQLQCTASGLDPCTKQLTASSPTASIVASPERVNAGANATIEWSAAQVSSCTITKNVSTVIGGPTAGPTIASTTATNKIMTQSVFTITCDGGAATDSVIVNVIPEFEEF
jgi:hypothetical protein